MIKSHSIECGGCGAPVQSQAKKSAHRYCSNACRQRAYRRRTKNKEGLGASSAIAVQAQLTTLIGREDEQVELHRRLQSNRLVTLTGPAGVGKTRLALEIAMQEQRHGQAKVSLTELSQLTDGRDLLQRIAAGFECSDTEGSRPTRSESSQLLVLDTCEHLLLECSEILSNLFAHNPNLRVLATSREPLFFPGEVITPISGLPFPGEDARESSMADFIRFPAVRLFVERARAVSPEFELDSTNSAHVGAICAQLDGIPLAIELAAQLIRVFPVVEIHHRLSDRLDFLVGGWRLADPRHQSLRAALDWSYDLLTPDEQQVFQSLSLLPDGFGINAATAAAPGAVAAPEVLKFIAALEAKSLITSDKKASGSANFRFLESVRCYAYSKLTAAGREKQVRDGIVDWLVNDIVTFAESGLLTPEVLSTMERERNNLSSAFESLSTGVDERQIPLAATLDALDIMKGSPPEVCIRLNLALKRAGRKSTYRPSALTLEALLAVWRGEYQNAATFAGEARTAGVAFHPAMRWRTELVLNLLRRLPKNAATVWNFRESLESSLRFNDTVSTMVLLYGLARHCSTMRNVGKISDLVTEAFYIARTKSLTGPLRALLLSAGALALAAGDFEEAASHFVELLHEADDNLFWSGRAVEGLAITSAHAGNYEHALRLLAAMQMPEEQPSYEMGSWWQMQVETAQCNAFAAVSPEKADRALKYGRTLRARQIVDCALGRQEARIETRTHELLSQRQWEVSSLLSQGLTNRQIAARLFVSVRTVETHVQSIRMTLGLKTRAHVAAWATQEAKQHGDAGSRSTSGYLMLHG